MSHEKGRPPAFKLATAQNSASAMPAQYDWETSRDLPALGSRPAYNASIRLPGILNLFDKVLLFGGARHPEAADWVIQAGPHGCSNIPSPASTNVRRAAARVGLGLGCSSIQASSCSYSSFERVVVTLR